MPIHDDFQRVKGSVESWMEKELYLEIVQHSWYLAAKKRNTTNILSVLFKLWF